MQFSAGRRTWGSLRPGGTLQEGSFEGGLTYVGFVLRGGCRSSKFEVPYPAQQ